jgi:hypothetical protein
MVSSIIEFLKRIAIRVFSSPVYPIFVGYSFVSSIVYGASNVIILPLWLMVDLFLSPAFTFYAAVQAALGEALRGLVLTVLVFIITFSLMIPMYIIEKMKKPVYEDVNWRRDGF